MIRDVSLILLGVLVLGVLQAVAYVGAVLWHDWRTGKRERERRIHSATVHRLFQEKRRDSGGAP